MVAIPREIGGGRHDGKDCDADHSTELDRGENPQYGFFGAVSKSVETMRKYAGCVFVREAYCGPADSDVEDRTPTAFMTCSVVQFRCLRKFCLFVDGTW